MSRPRFLPDNFVLLLLATVLLASLLPASGVVAQGLKPLTTVAVGLLFFLHGAKLSRQAIWAGLGHWRLHLLVGACTFVLFPLLGWALQPLLAPLVTPALYMGVLFLCALPSTVQSSIALVSIARGNMPAAICSASASTLLGILLTPLLVGLLLSQSAAAGDPLGTIVRIAALLLLPFVAGHLLRPWVGGFIQRRGSLLKIVDQGSILLVVYGAFSQAVLQGLWTQVPLAALGALALVCALVLALALVTTTWLARRLGFSREDEIVAVFCGSQKSLVSGVPMAAVLFGAQAAGAVVLPLMLYHQMQLMVAAVLARRYAQRADAAEAPAKALPARTA